MSWKATGILGVMAAASFGAWFLLQPKEESHAVRPRPFEWREGTYQSIRIRRPDQPDIVLKRQPSQVLGSFWHLETPAKPVDDSRIVEMIGALRRLTRDRSFKPGDAEYTPDAYGFNKPAATIEISAAGDKRTLIFGNQSVRHTGARFYKIEGENEIYLGPTDALPAFERSIADLRSRQFVGLDPAKVVAVEVSQKFQRAGKDGKPGLQNEYEKLRFELREKAAPGLKPGWYLTAINGVAREEKIEDVKVGYVITYCRDLKAEEYVALPAPAEYGFGQPELTIKFDVLDAPSNSVRPFVVDVGKTEDRGARKVTFVRVAGEPEAAVVSTPFVERIPHERKQFISAELIDFNPGDLGEILIVMDSGHRVKLVKQEVEEKRGTETFRKISWQVKEPATLKDKIDQNLADEFANFIPQVTISNILGEQPDLKVFGLEPPMATMTLTIKPKNGAPQERVYKIGRPGNSRFGYVLKPGSTDVFELTENTIRRIERADLNFRKPEMFNISPAAIVGVAFSYKGDHLSAMAKDYAVRKVEGGKWEFEDEASRKAGMTVDEDRMSGIIGMLNFVKAENFISRSERAVKDFGLTDRETMGRLVIRYADPANPGKSTQIAFRISRSILDPTGQVRHYYAKIEPASGDTDPSSDATIVFRIQSQVIEALRLGVHFEPR